MPLSLLKVLIIDKVKQIVSTEKFDNTKILTDTDNKLLDDITSKNVVILATCVLKGNGIFHPQILEEALLVTWKISNVGTFQQLS